jgi:hypothetical protein
VRTKTAALALAALAAAFAAQPAAASSPTAVGAASPATVAPGGSTLLTVGVTPGAAPASTGLYVSCNLSSVGGSFMQLFADDGTAGDTSPGDRVFSFRATVDPAASLGPRSLSCVISDAQGRSTVAQIALTVDALANQPPTVDGGGPYTAREGQAVPLAASGIDPEGAMLAFAWDLDGDGVFETAGRTGSVAVDDGPSTRVVAVRAQDPAGGFGVAAVSVEVANVAPTAQFVRPREVQPSAAFSLSLVDPADPSSADTKAGFTYSFDCGSGYSAWSRDGSARCDGGLTSRSVGARIRDKDGGVSAYSATVATQVTYAGLCRLTVELARRHSVARSLCKLLSRAEHTRSPRKRARLLAAYRAGVRAHTGRQRRRAFTPADGAMLVRLSRSLG